MFFLLVRDSGGEPALRMEAKSGIEIGRSPDSQCVLTDPNVGRKAAKIVEENGVFYVEDMGSTNRTVIRGVRKLAKGEREPLRHGLFVDLGRSSIEIEEDRPAPEDATDSGDATDAGDANFGEQTMIASPSSDGRRPQKRAPEPAFDQTLQQRRPEPQVDQTLQERRPAPPAPKNPEPVVQPPPMARPTPELAPRPVPSERNVSASTSDFMGPGGIGSGTQSIRPISGDLGALGTMITRRPRLVIVNEADRRIVPLEKISTMIGRESGDCRIDHKAISQPHAMIRFVSTTNNFQIEDRKSRNQTFVGGVALNPESPQLLPPEALVRFGAIEAVFVVDRDSENAEIPPAQYAAAVRYLQANKLVTPEQVHAAQEESKAGVKHVGEALMIAGAVSARHWTKAFENSKGAVQQAASLPKGRRLWVMVAVGAVVIAGILAAIFHAKLGF